MTSKKSAVVKTSAEESQPDPAANLRTALEAFIREHDSYLYGREFASYPKSLFEACGSLAMAIVSVTEFPDDLRHCLEAFAEFSASWLQFVKTEAPEPGVAFHATSKALVQSAEQQPRRIEEVSQLLEDLKTYDGKYDQIARMFGQYSDDLDRYTGPFFTARGVPDIAKIEQEGRKPGSIIQLGWTPQSEMIAARQAAASERIADLAKQYRTVNRQNSGAPAGDPDSVEQLLRDGAFPDQIAMVKGVSEASVRVTAAKMGIVLRSRDEILNEKGRELWGEKREREDGPFLRAMNEVAGG